ncbi:MAG: Uma2 family endonuclease [Synechococcales cyanobacterium RM1_1_8]|nr:Uma2 family endonuclease [Synechococcales cyanobacterium RM1_1_8]
MLQVDPKLRLPSSAELPCSDDTPVDNEDQNLLPNYLLFLLQQIWAERQDWFFAVDMGLYHTTGSNPRIPIVPDAFLSLGVERKKQGKSRLSYVTWEENGVPPILTLEMVSQTPGGEYERKREIYRQLGVLYYVIYNPEYGRRDGHEPFEIYKLMGGDYQLQAGEPFWMPEIGLGLGRRELSFGGIAQEGLSWFDEQGQPYLNAGELARQAEQRQQQTEALARQAEQERDRAQQQQERLAAKLRELGVDPDEV